MLVFTENPIQSQIRASILVSFSHMGDFPQPQQKSAGAGESSDFEAIRAGPSQMATFMPFWI